MNNQEPNYPPRFDNENDLHDDGTAANGNEEEPAFIDISSTDVIEVETLDDTTDHVPMDDDDDYDVDIVDDEDENERITDADQIDDDDPNHTNVALSLPPSHELFLTITSHTGPVYTCAVLAIDTSTTTQIETTVATTTTTKNDSTNYSAVPPSRTRAAAATTTTTSSSSSSALLIATGGGDDIACLTRAVVVGPNDQNDSQVMMTNNNPVESSSVMMMITEEDDESRSTKNNNQATTVTTQQLAYQHSDSVSAVAFGSVSNTSTPTTTTTPSTNTSNLLLAVGGYDGMIVLYDGTTGACLMNISNKEEFRSNFAGPTDIEWLTFHKTGTVLLAGSSTDGTVWMYHIVVPSAKQPYYTLNCMQVFVGHASMVSAGGFTADGRWAVSIGNSGTRDDATVRIWNPKTGIAKHTLHLHSGSTTGVLMSTNTYNNDDDDDTPFAGLTCLAFGIADEVTSSSTTMSTTTPNNATASTSSKLLLVGSEDGWAYVCHVGTGKVLNAFRHAAEPLPTMYNNSGMDVVEEQNDARTELLLSIEAVGFCPSNPIWCATGGADGVLKIWDLNNGQCRHLCRYQSTTVNISSDNLKKKTSTIGGITRLCWLPSNTATTTAAATAIGTAMIPHPPVIFVATTDGMVHVWDARNGELLRTLQTGGHATILDLQVLLIDNHRIVVVTASEDHSVRLFQLSLADLLQPKQ